MSEVTLESAVQATLEFLQCIAGKSGLLVDGVDIGMQANSLLARLETAPDPDTPCASCPDAKPVSIEIGGNPRWDRLRLPGYSCGLWCLLAELLASLSVADAAEAAYGGNAHRFASDLDAALRDISRYRWLRDCDDDNGEGELLDEAVDAAIAEVGEGRLLDS